MNPRQHLELVARALLAALAAFTLAACTPKDTLDRSEVECTRKVTLDGSEVETVLVDGQLYEVRVASTEVEVEYRLLIVPGITFIDPDLHLESQRNWNIAQLCGD